MKQYRSSTGCIAFQHDLTAAGGATVQYRSALEYRIVLAAGDGALTAAHYGEDRKARKADETCELPVEMLNN